jgi:hypothetical protein
MPSHTEAAESKTTSISPLAMKTQTTLCNTCMRRTVLETAGPHTPAGERSSLPISDGNHHGDHEVRFGEAPFREANGDPTCTSS